jgi:TrmH family RNA methyltransferase
MALSRREVQFVRSLNQKKFRQKYNKFAVEGDKIAREALAQSPDQIDHIWALPEWLEANGLSSSGQGDMAITAVTPRELKQLSHMRTPNQVVFTMHLKDPDWKPSVVQAHLSLYLDGIQDPGNAGTLLRIADWFGLAGVFATPDSADLYNSKVLQASMGSFLRTPYLRLPLEELLRSLPEGFPVLGASLEGESVFAQQFPRRGLLVVGREGSGLRPAVLAQLTHRLYVPGGGRAESLNAAVATGIVVAQLLYGRP